MDQIFLQRMISRLPINTHNKGQPIIQSQLVNLITSTSVVYPISKSNTNWTTPTAEDNQEGSTIAQIASTATGLVFPLINFKVTYML